MKIGGPFFRFFTEFSGKAAESSQKAFWISYQTRCL